LQKRQRKLGYVVKPETLWTRWA